MNPSLDKALYYLTGNGNIDEVSVEDVERLTKEHPYFSVGHLLLAKKLKLADDNRFEAQARKAALYIANPYWLHYQLLNYPPPEIAFYDVQQPGVNAPDEVIATRAAEEAITKIEQPPVATATPSPHEELLQASPINHIYSDVHDEKPEETVPITTAFSLHEIEEASSLAHQSLAIEPPVEPVHETVPITTTFSSEEIEAASVLAHDVLQPIEDTVDINEPLAELPPPDTTVPEEYTDVPSVDELNNLQNDSSSSVEETKADTPVVEPELLVVDQDEVVEVNAQAEATDGEETAILLPAPSLEVEARGTGDQPIPEEASIHEFQPVHPTASQEEEELAAISREPDPTAEAFIEDLEPASLPQEEPANEAEPDEHEQMFQNIKAMLDATTDEAGRPVDNDTIPIDPYHTVDYFASQGIKLELEQNPQDKLGKQLKKFTHWLKQMKKLGPEDALETVVDDQAEAHVQQSADTSNTAREVVTEAMARVLEKQGKKDKAVQLYIKLSFLNPDKSVYFADKIKNLKGI